MRRFLLAVLALALVGWFATGIAKVRSDERAVVRRFGKVVARPGPGLWIGWPSGIDRIDRVKVQTVRQLEVGPTADTSDDPNATGQYLTGDQNLIHLRIVLEYAVDDRDGTFEQFVVHEDRLEAILTREVESLAGEWAAGIDIDRALLGGRSLLPAWMLPRLKDRLVALNLGVLVQRIALDTVAPPAEVRPAFEAVNQAQIAAGTKENEARLDAARRLREAETVKFQLARRAEAETSAKLSAAQAEADVFVSRLVRYRALAATNPDVLETIWWNETGKLLAALKARGRIDVLDAYLAGNGLDITQFFSPKKR